MPTVLRVKNYRFFFFSREENREHIHIQSSNGEAKFWLKPKIELAKNYKLTSKELKEVENIVNENHQDFLDKWSNYFEN
jgi:hypothetical protein